MGIRDWLGQFTVAGLFEKWGFHEVNSPGVATLTLSSDEAAGPFRGLPADKRFDGTLGPGVPVSIIVGHKIESHGETGRSETYWYVGARVGPHERCDAAWLDGWQQVRSRRVSLDRRAASFAINAYPVFAEREEDGAVMLCWSHTDSRGFLEGLLNEIQDSFVVL